MKTVAPLLPEDNVLSLNKQEEGVVAIALLSVANGDIG